MKKIILYVHQSADLYGSDRVLLALVGKLDKEKFTPIVLLPVDGPLRHELEAAGIECHVIAITRLARATLSMRGLLGLPIDLIKSLHAISRVLEGRKVSLMHTNTLAVLSAPLWARWHRIPHIWHVHEIIVNPVFVRRAYGYLLDWFADCIICVSHATKENLVQDRPTLANKIEVVWNGFERNIPVNKAAAFAYREQLIMRPGEVLVTLVGRINRWKGQTLLLEAANLLWQQNVHNIRYLFVGSAPDGQGHFFDALQQGINQSPAQAAFTVQGFTNSLSTVWDACDIAVIPSTEPEPFGMVALEAMAAAKPIVAANHGGLAEIIVNGETGYLVAPSNVTALAESIKKLATDAPLRKKMGDAGQTRYSKEFTLNRYVAHMTKIYNEVYQHNE